MEGDAIEYEHFYSPTAGPEGSSDPNRSPFDTLPGGDDDGKHEHIDLSWDDHKVSTSTRRGSLEGTRSKLAELESSKDEARNKVLNKYPKANSSIITASKDEFGRTVIHLLNRKNAARYPLKDNGSIGNNRKGGTPGKTLLNAFGPQAVKVLDENDEVMKSLDDELKRALKKNKEYDEAQQENVNLQLWLDLVIKELAKVRETAAQREAHFRKVIERNTQLEIDLRNAGEDQRAELARQLANGRAEIEQLQ